MDSTTRSVRFETERLLVVGWRTAASEHGLDLAALVSELLTTSTTRSLPAEWRGEYSIARARRWIAERDRESPTLLAVDRRTGAPVGLVIVFESPSDDGSGSDLRVGYLLSESVWGQGLATELVAGLVAWAREQPSISTLTAGVEATNTASARVLLTSGFTEAGSADEGQLVFRLHVDRANPWDEYAAGWDDDPDARAYAAAAFESLVAELEHRRISLGDTRVCELGCGTGLLTERLVGAVQSIDAVDTSTAMLAQVSAKIRQRRWTNVRPSIALPESVETHDLVVCSSVLGFVDDHPGTVRRLSELLRPKGVFVQWDWERDPADPDPHGLTRDEIRDAMVTAGFVGLRVDTPFEISVADVTMRPLMGVGQKAGTRGE